MSYNCNSPGYCPRKYYFSNPDIRIPPTNIYAGDNLRNNTKAIRVRALAISRLSQVLSGSNVSTKELPQITRQPVGGTLASGPLTLEVAATDSNSPKLSLSYQWYRDGQVLPGENKRNLELQRTLYGRAGKQVLCHSCKRCRSH